MNLRASWFRKFCPMIAGLMLPVMVLCTGCAGRSLASGLHTTTRPTAGKSTGSGRIIWHCLKRPNQEPKVYVPDVHLSVIDADTGHTVRRLTSIAEGPLVIHGLPPDEYRLELTDSSFQSRSQLLELPAASQVDATFYVMQAKIADAYQKEADNPQVGSDAHVALILLVIGTFAVLALASWGLSETGFEFPN